MSLQVRTTRLPDDRPLLDLLPDVGDDRRFAFIREGEGLVAWGIAAELSVGTGPRRLSEAAGTLSEIAGEATVEDPVSLPGSGLVALGSFTFDATNEGSILRIPQVVIGRRSGVMWRTDIISFGSGSCEDDWTAVPIDEGSGGTMQARRGTDRTRYAGSTLDDMSWLEAAARAVAAIESGELEKVVLARDLHLWSRTPFDTRQVLHALAARFPSCFTFLVDHLVGASPELLLRVDGALIASRVLAGTAPRGSDPTDDERIGDALLASSKDRLEHDLATRSAEEVLRSVCDELHVPDGPSLLRLDNVQHLGSDLHGRLREPRHVLELLDVLHPTAAVAGTPRTKALERIGTLEGMDRGRYAGPVGWCSPDGDGEFAIALRCGELRGTRARLFAGAGIVAGSLPEAELTETWLKLRAMSGVLDAGERG
jgi:menaquinone-specific isochorismate synthase